MSSVLLSDIEQYQIQILNPNELVNWPENAIGEEYAKTAQLLPKGFKVKFMLRDVEYEWILTVLNTDFLKEQKNEQP